MSEISGKKRKSSHGEAKDRSKKRKVQTAESDPVERNDRKKDKKRKREVANGDGSLIPEPAVGVSKKAKTKKGMEGKKRASETMDEVEPQPALSNQKSTKDAKRSKPEKKPKNKTKSTADATNGEPDVTEPAEEAKSKKNKSKKRKKSKANGAETGEPNDAENAKVADDQSEEATKRFIVFIGMRPELEPQASNTIRKPSFYGDQGVNCTAFSGRSAAIYPPLNTQGYRKVKRMRVCRVPSVRPHEDLPGALPPVEFRRRPVSTKEDKRRSNVGALC